MPFHAHYISKEGLELRGSLIKTTLQQAGKSKAESHIHGQKMPFKNIQTN
jgi:hypothetical protein